MIARLFVVFLFAKILTVWAAGGSWTSMAFVGQDLVVAALVGFWRKRALYWAAVVYVGLNVPVAVVMSTPATASMIGATGGALGDSIVHHLSLLNVALIAAVLACAWVAARARLRASVVLGPALLAAAVTCFVVAPVTGYHRNALATIATSGFRGAPRAADPWRPELRVGDRRAPLDGLRGCAAERNVVVVMLESTAAQYLSLYGAPEDPMPRVTEFAGEGVVFEGMYAAYPESIKGLFALLCSTYPALSTPARAYAVENFSRPSLAQELRAAGYRTALFHSGRFGYLGMREVVTDRGFEVLRDGATIESRYGSTFGVDEPSTVREILGFVDGLRRDERFFIMYMPIAGHHPYLAPGATDPPFPLDSEINFYRNSLHYGDASIGALIDGMRERGHGDDTLWIFLGDHGEAFYQHEGNYAHSLYLYEENVRVPFMVVAPGATTPARVRRTGSIVDVAPTILDLLGRRPPEDWEGSSLLSAESRMPFFFTDYAFPLVGLRDGGWKFIDNLETGRAQLFDLAADPSEKRDVASSHPARVGRYRRLLRSWVVHQKALFSDRVR